MDRRPTGKESASSSASEYGPTLQPPGFPPSRADTDLNSQHSSAFRGHGAERPSTWKVIAKILPRWLMIVAVAAAFYGVLEHYAKLDVMTKTQKRVLNGLLTGLSIGLGVAVAASLDGMIGDVRWWILSRRFRSRHKVESILQADSMVSLLKLAYRTRRKTIHSAVLGWGWGQGAQVTVASIGLCYSTDTAENHALMVPGGTVFIPNLSSIQAGDIVNETTTSLGAQQFMANNYGIISTAIKPGDNFSVIPEARSIVQPGAPATFCEGPACRYLFKELSFDPAQPEDDSLISVTTSRTIEASTTCNASPVVSGGDGSVKSISVAMGQGNTDVSIPTEIGTNATIYMTDTSQSCGDGCSVLSAFSASATAPWYYQCNVTVGQVANGTRPEHEASTNLRNLMADAIALQGYAASSFAGNSEPQFQTYPSESLFGRDVNGGADELAKIISRFTIGAFAAFADNNKFIQVEGDAPRRGIVLDITHPGIILFLFLLVIGITLALEIGMAIWANRVVVPPDSPLAIAQVLREMTVQRPRGHRPHQLKSYPTGDGKSLTDRKGEPLWIYRCIERPEVGMYDLYMEGSISSHSINERNEIEMTETHQSQGMY
ncbi:hypothetical protein PG996_013095 [Apiospora saccharicola]|uniref:Uncharacterized protein n=1 Tax=Apiospora saccharicola TaxID=335842 RepID=A0ABR1U7B3_9PEZI